MTVEEVYKRAIRRYKTTTGDKCPDMNSIVVFLEKEIERLQEAEQLEKRREDEFTKYTKETADFCETAKDAICALNERVTQLCEQSTKWETLSVERAADGGTMTVTNKNEAWRTIAMNLFRNGYFVCVHNEPEEQTVTIEFWRA